MTIFEKSYHYFTRRVLFSPQSLYIDEIVDDNIVHLLSIKILSHQGMTDFLKNNSA